MSSQWTRGGAFHCFKNQRLVEAVTKLITSVDVCPLDLSCSRWKKGRIIKLENSSGNLDLK